MIIIGVDFHPEFQQIASVATSFGDMHPNTCHHSKWNCLYPPKL